MTFNGSLTGATSLSIAGSTRVFAGQTFITSIGSASTRTLALNGAGTSSMWWNGSGTPQFAIDSLSGGGASFWSYGVAWNERMRMLSTGEVGINVTAPVNKLEVGGNISSTGFMYGSTLTGFVSVASPLIMQGTNQVLDTLSAGGGNSSNRFSKFKNSKFI